MSLFDRIKSLLGLEREERVPSGESRVTVEREPGGAEPATAAENAVKGTDADGVDTAPEVSGDGETTAADEEPSAADTDATASTGSMVDEDAGIEPAEAVAEADTDTGPAAEPAEAAGPVADEPEVEAEDADAVEESDDSDAEVEETDADTDTEAEDAAAMEFDGPGAEEPTDSIRGIGPSYGERLADAGVETVGELAGADAAALSEATGVSEKRLAGWVEQARDRLE